MVRFNREGKVKIPVHMTEEFRYDLAGILSTETPLSYLSGYSRKKL